MATYSIKTVYVNGTQQSVTNPDTTQLSYPISFYYPSNYVLDFIIIDDDGNPIDLTGCTFIFGIDDVFTVGHGDLVRCDDSKFNISGDWSEVSLSGGKISCRVNCGTPALLAAIGADEYIDGYGCLWAVYSGSNYLLTQFSCLLRNPISDIEADFSNESSSSNSSIDSSSSSSTSESESSSSSSSSEDYSESSSSSSTSNSSESSGGPSESSSSSSTSESSSSESSLSDMSSESSSSSVDSSSSSVSQSSSSSSRDSSSSENADYRVTLGSPTPNANPSGLYYENGTYNFYPLYQNKNGLWQMYHILDTDEWAVTEFGIMGSETDCWKGNATIVGSYTGIGIYTGVIAVAVAH